MLPAKNRLKDKKDFNLLFRSGRTFSNDLILMKMSTANSKLSAQIGFAVGIKFSKKAVERNRMKRWLREAVREKIGLFPTGSRIIFMVSPNFPKEDINFNLIQEKLENILKKSKIIK